MVSRAEKNDKLLKSLARNLHNSTFPEDSVLVARPTDAELYGYVDKLAEDYSWREDILRDEIRLHIFKNGQEGLVQQSAYNILRWLRQKKYIHFINADEDGWILINIPKEDNLNYLLTTLRPQIVPARIVYSPSNNMLIFNGKKHRMHEGSNTRKIFHLLATHANERITKAQVWRSINQRNLSKRENNTFSSLIKRVRTSVGATNQEIYLKDTVVLNAKITISDRE
jgi:hypothetical protein